MNKYFGPKRMREMTRTSGLLALTLLLGVMAGSISAAERRPSAKAITGSGATTAIPHVDENGSALLLGVVTDSAGAPLAGTLLSALGSAGTSLAVCDADGRFEFRGLRPGPYLLRAHRSGFTTTRRFVVNVTAGTPTLQAVTLRSELPNEGPPMLLAGFGSVSSEYSFLGGLDQSDTGGVADSDAVVAAPTEPALEPHDHSERAWRLRRARRSVLKDTGGAISWVGTAEAHQVLTPERVSSPSSDVIPSNDLAGGFPISGELHLLARTAIASPVSLWSADRLPGQVTHLSLGESTTENEWMVRGAVDMSSGNASSWVLAGTYLAELVDDHTLHLDMSYSKHQLQQPGAGSLLVPRPAPSARDESREVGSIAASGVWTVSPHLSVGYGARLARYGYLEDGKLFSPRAEVNVVPLARTRVRVSASQNMLAPGAEEFLPPSTGVWLPPERSFVPLSAVDSLQVERVRQLEMTLERELGTSSVIGVRRFYQAVNDQMVAMFGVQAERIENHYYLTNANGVNAEGWGVTFSHKLTGHLQTAVEYSVTSAQWLPWNTDSLLPSTVGAFRTGTEQFHDVTTSVETEIPQTATRVFLVWKVNTAFSRVDDKTLTSGLDGRFNLRVKQVLPFTPFEGSQWEVIVGLRSLFRERLDGASAYDELLVVSPPKQFLGGLVVHF